MRFAGPLVVVAFALRRFSFACYTRDVRWLAISLVFASSAASADEATQPGTSDAKPTPNRINLRLGNATTDSTGRPVICVDVRIWRGLGVESCGTGQGVIHNEPGEEIVHFRATWSVFEKAFTTGTGRLRGGIGWAELQVGVDHPGFHFGDPDSVDRGSVAGPEGSVQGQFLVPLGKGLEAIASVTAGVAVFAGADKLITPQNNVQPHKTRPAAFPEMIFVSPICEASTSDGGLATRFSTPPAVSEAVL